MGKEGKFGRSNCSTATALEVVGDRWSLLLVRDYIFAERREFGDFLELREGISTNVLSSRLAWLAESGIFVKHAHPTNGKKFYYEITPKGFDLIVVIMELARWGWAHLPEVWSPPQVREAYLKNPKGFVADWRKRALKRSADYLAEAKGE